MDIFIAHPTFLYLSQVEFFTIIPPISTSCLHQLFVFVPSTISIWNIHGFLTLAVSLLLASLLSGHMLHLSSCNYALPYTQL